jgi:hypothetical protein
MEVLTLCGRGKVFYETLLIVNELVSVQRHFCSHNSTGSYLFVHAHFLTIVLILFIYFYFILQDSPHQTNIKLIQISTSALAGTDHRDKLQ